MLLFGIFLHYFGLLGLLPCFVTNKICCNLSTFLVKLFGLKPCLCKKKLSFCISGSKQLRICSNPICPVHLGMSRQFVASVFGVNL